MADFTSKEVVEVAIHGSMDVSSSLMEGQMKEMEEATSIEALVLTIDGSVDRSNNQIELTPSVNDDKLFSTTMGNEFDMSWAIPINNSALTEGMTEEDSKINWLRKNKLNNPMADMDTEGSLDEGPPASIKKNLDPNWVASMKEKLHVEPAKIKASAAKDTCSIHRVPHSLRQHDRKAYMPQMISIGPYHYRRRRHHLRAMEEHKWRYLNAIINRNGEDCFERYLIAMKELEDETRECYSEIIELDSNSFVEMMVLDGCFLIEVFCRTWDCDWAEEDEDDPIFSLGWLYNTLIMDLIMLENQIPFFILRRLFYLMDIPAALLVEMALNLFPSAPKKNEKLNHNDTKVLHLLHLLYCSLLPLSNDENPITGTIDMIPSASELPNVENLPTGMIDMIPSASELPNVENPPTDTINMIPSASELQEAGMKFKKGDVDSFLDIKFQKQKGVIEIPPLTIEDSTNCLFRNLIAFEQCYHHCKSYFAPYRRFMDCLINSAKDVEILCRNGIINNWLGSEEDVAALFNSMGRDVCLSGDDFYLLQVFNEINQYYETRWHRWRASLMRNYFHNPWAIISLIAAAVLLLLTLIQAFFSSFPKFAYGN